MSGEEGVGLWSERWSDTLIRPGVDGFIAKHGLDVAHDQVTVNVFDDQGHPIEAEVAHLDANHIAIRVGYHVGGLGEAQWHTPYYEAVVVTIVRSA